MRVVILASGSRGNATVFESTTAHGPSTRVLVDAGLSRRAMTRRLLALQEPERLDAIVITHAHHDHVGHCQKLAARYRVPLYMSESTARTTRIDEARIFSPREPFAIGAFEITPTPLPHDAAQVALTFSDGVGKAALCTDLGEVPGTLPAVLSGVDILLIESNYDLQMLRYGPYPDSVKRRVASAGGHLSNEQTAELLRSIAPTLSKVVLMHLSQSNNQAQLALGTARDALAGHDVELLAAHQDRPMVIEPRPRRAPVRTRPALPARRSTQLAFAFAT